MAKKVLVVEDDTETQKLIDFLLRRDGFEVVVAGDGEAGLRLAAEKPDLVIVDLMLPKLNGLEVIGGIKDNPETQNIPILILSALGQESYVSKALKKGADEYIVKPFSTGYLVAEVKRLLRIGPAYGEKG
ncbi:MAG: response regulator [Elusimicrobia bacterium]|nr:response regulator [Elusimicrobiota bacterium]